MPLAGKPLEWFVVPDPKFVGAANLVSATSEAGPYPGSVSGVVGNLGMMRPEQGGELTASSASVVYQTVQAGGPGVGEWAWRFDADASDQFRGVDDSRRFWGFHAPFTDALGSDNCACAFAEAFRRIVVCRVDAGADTVVIRYRDVDTDRHDEWTETSFVLENSIAAGEHSAQMLDLPDGRLMLVIRRTADFDVYHSTDGGLTWELVSDAIVNTFNTPGMSDPTHDLSSQFRVARAGEHIRLVWITAGGVFRTFLSTDRGVSWARLDDGSASTPFQVAGAVDDEFPFALVGIDDVGTFKLAYAAGAGSHVQDVGTGTGAWTTQTAAIASPQALKHIVMVRTPEYVWSYAYWSDTGTSTNDGWQVLRARSAQAKNPITTWEKVDEAQRYDTGIRYAPGRVSACWAGHGVFLHGARRDSTAAYADINLPCAWYHGGWTRRSLWRNRPTKSLSALSNPLYGRFWTVECDQPDMPAGSPWTAAGGGSTLRTMDSVEISSTAGNPKSFTRTIAAATGPAWGQDYDACFGWMIRLDTGDGSLTADEVAVRVISRDLANTTRLDISIRHAPTGLRLRDNNAAADLDDVAITLDTGPTGQFFEVRVWMATRSGLQKAQMAVLDTDTGEWLEGAVVTLTTAAAAGSNSVEWGNLTAPGAGTTRSWWREFWITEQSDAHQAGFTNPTSLVGQSMSGTGVYVAHGLTARWGGVSGALGDQFDGDVAHTHPAGALAEGSPRRAWRGTDLAAQELIFDADPENGADVWNHDAIGLFGCNCREVLVDYDSDVAFGSPTATETVDFTAFGTGTTALEVDATVGTGVAIVAASTTQFVAGELVGCYVRPTSGGAAGATWKITRHDTRDTFQCEEETTTLATQGLAATDTLIVFRPDAVLVYSAAVAERYMRLRFADTDTAEGYHRLGTAVPGRQHVVSVPLDWARTDNQQPNLTSYRTRGALAWYYEEGPPQRTWTARLVGDVTQRERSALRGLLRQIGFERRPLAWCFDDDNRVDSCALVRWTGGSQHDEAGFFADANGVARAAGDLSIVLVEEV
jgi:hypothetical protein